MTETEKCVTQSTIGGITFCSQRDAQGEHIWVGDAVIKPKGYPFPGIVVAEFPKLDGEIRYVVESTTLPGMLHIFAGNQLQKVYRL